jgi:hypothetical protein
MKDKPWTNRYCHRQVILERSNAGLSLSTHVHEFTQVTAHVVNPAEPGSFPLLPSPGAVW